MTEPHLACQTMYTRTGKRSMINHKPKSRRVKVNVSRDLDGAYRVNGRLDRKQKPKAA